MNEEVQEHLDAAHVLMKDKLLQASIFQLELAVKCLANAGFADAERRQSRTSRVLRCLEDTKRNADCDQWKCALYALSDAIAVMNEQGKSPPATPPPTPKPLTLADLKQQVDMNICLNKPPETGDFVWTTQDFEIRRRK